MIKTPILTLIIAAFFILFTLGCSEQSAPQQSAESAGITKTGVMQDAGLDESSGIQSSSIHDDVFFSHNDDGVAQVFAVSASGADLGSFVLEGADNRDWEDITGIPSDEGSMIVVADTGDNFAQHDSVFLYFFAEPAADENGKYSGSIALSHKIELTYPEGARDCESVAYDASSDRIWFLSKRDKPSRIYSISRAEALTLDVKELEYEGTVHTFRPPTSRDMVTFGQRDGPWVSQPTGLTFNPQGTEAAVISYRSTYLFRRVENETWPQAFARKPLEFEGPPSQKEEAISYDRSGENLIITTEGVPAPIYRFRIDPPEA